MALTDNILAYWNLNNNGSGGVSLVDSTGNGYTLTNNTGIGLGTGIIFGAGTFNGSDYISNSSFLIPNSAFTISGWVKSASYEDGSVIWGQWNYDNSTAPMIGVGCNYEKINVFWSTDGSGLTDRWTTEINIPYDNEWHHMVLTFDGTTEVIYWDGISQGTFIPSGLANPTAGFGLGQGNGAGITGVIDETAVWNRALTQAEITKLYNSGDGLTYPFQQFYFSGGNLSTLGNWWEDSAFTIPATSLPTSEDTVVISSAVTSGTATYASANITANIGSSVTITAPTQITNAVNSGTLIGATTLNGTASNVGTITGNATLNGTTSNVGTITGNATVYYPAQNPLGGSVSGTITYFWPGGTGLWGGDVWIDGSLSFIIPDPSDVKAGVEYGPAENPYVGTFSGGGGIDLARLIGLPPFIQL